MAMTIEIFVPDIGADEVEVTDILVKVGDKVSADQSLLAVEGDKASMEVPAPVDGVVQEIRIKAGDKVKTGSLIMVFAAEGAAAAPAAPVSAPAPVAAPAATPAPAAAPAAAQLQEVQVPDIGGDEVEVTEVMVKVGDTVTADQSLLSVEGDKASMEVPAPFAGTVVEVKVKAGDKVKTGSLVFVFSTGAAPAVAVAAPAAVAAPVATPAPAAAAAPVAATSAPAAPATAVSDSQVTQSAAFAHASPVVRRLAREFGVDLSKVSGTARKGRIQREDVQNYVKNIIKQVTSGNGSAIAAGAPGNNMGFDLLAWPKVDFSKFGAVEEKPLSRIQKISGANLHRNWVRIPHVTQFDEADITELEEFRKEQNTLAEKKKLGVKYTPLVFIMKAVAKALEEFPTFNSSLSEDGASLVLKKYVHLGIAVDTPNGLVVPVVRDVNKKGIIELSRELQEISLKAREGKLTAADMQGGCFTISSLGGIGGTAFTPIVNAPEVAILGVSKSDIKPKWDGKAFQPRLMVPLSVSYDHRVIDGALAARFTATLGSYLSDIRQIIM